MSTLITEQSMLMQTLYLNNNVCCLHFNLHTLPNIRYPTVKQKCHVSLASEFLIDPFKNRKAI